MDRIRLLCQASGWCTVLNPMNRKYLQRVTTSRLIHGRTFHHPIKSTKDTSTTPSNPKPNQHAEKVSFPSLNLWRQIGETRPAVRYTVYAFLGLMVSVESTFWFNVVKANFFPSASVEEKEKADQFLERLDSAVREFRRVWLVNYERYYGAYLWGLGYGGLDGLEDEQR